MLLIAFTPSAIIVDLFVKPVLTKLQLEAKTLFYVSLSGPPFTSMVNACCYVHSVG